MSNEDPRLQLGQFESSWCNGRDDRRSLGRANVSYFLIEQGDDSCEMVVGYTFRERLLEIGLRYLDSDFVYVFHAQNVSPQFKKRFGKEWKNG